MPDKATWAVDLCHGRKQDVLVWEKVPPGKVKLEGICVYTAEHDLARGAVVTPPLFLGTFVMMHGLLLEPWYNIFPCFETLSIAESRTREEGVASANFAYSSLALRFGGKYKSGNIPQQMLTFCTSTLEGAIGIS